MSEPLSPNPESQLHLTRRWEYCLLLLVLILGAFLRIYRLPTIPPGLTHDEADFSHDGIAVYHGARPFYVATYGYQDEPLMHYASAMMMVLMGPSYLAVRATSAFFGVLLILFTYLWARVAFGMAVAFAAATWLAVSYWPVSTSRFALQVEPTASLAVLASLFFWLGLGLHRSGSGHLPRGHRWLVKDRARNGLYWVLFALSITASLYTYEATRITWFLFPLFGFYLLLARPDLVKRNWWKIGLALTVAALFALPLLTHPAAWDRAGRLSGVLEDMQRGSFESVLKNTSDVLATFTLEGDPFVTYNIPGRPVLDPIAGLLLIGGTLVCLRRWRRPACIFILLWFVVGILPSVLTEVHSSSLRSIVAQPATYIIPAVAFVELLGWFSRRLNVPFSLVITVGLALVVTGTGWLTYRDYYLRWARSPETQGAYFSDLFKAVRHLDAAHSGESVVISAPFPNLPHDPYVAEVIPVRHNLDLRWVNGQRALIFPSASSTSSARLLTLSRSPLDRLLVDALDSQYRERMQVEGTENSFDVLAWSPTNTLTAIRGMCGSMAVGVGGSGTLPVDFGHSVELVGYDLESPTISGGETVQVVTLWRVLSPEPLGPVPAGFYGYDAAIFVHLLDENGQVVTQEDRLDAPAWDWRPGDTFVQIHRLATPELSHGRYDVEIGLYTRPDVRRLPVYVNGEPRGDRLLLRSLEVVDP